MNKSIVAILILAVIALGAWLIFFNKAAAPSSVAPEISLPIEEETQEGSNETLAPTPQPQGEIEITTPRSGAVISSPVSLSGRARGSWYFEASAPVELINKEGTRIAQGFVTAQGEWMTTEFVPFKGELSFEVPEGVTEGYLIFMNDNPSGLPENSRSVRIPVKFSE